MNRINSFNQMIQYHVKYFGHYIYPSLDNGGVLSCEIKLVTEYILLLHIICINTIHRYQPYYGFGVR